MEADAVTPLPSSLDIERLGQNLLLGLKRQPLALPQGVAALMAAGGDGPPAPALLALVLAGQHSRFQRLDIPAFGARAAQDAAIHADPRPMLSEASRAALKHFLMLVKKHGAFDACFAACWNRVTRRGLRLHPFDLPELAPQINAVESRFPFVASAKEAPAVEDTETWRQLPKDQRLDTLRRLRQSQPDTARAMVEACFKSEPPALRAELLGVLAMALNAGDAAFLELALKDRSQDVRDTAKRLIGRIPGTPAHQERLRSAAASMMLTKDGLPPRWRRLIFKADMAKAKRRPQRIIEVFAGLGVEQLAAALDMTPDAFIEALPEKDDAFIYTLIATAATQGDDAMATRLVAELNETDSLSLLAQFPLSGQDISEESRIAIMSRLVELAGGATYPEGWTLLALFKHAGGSLPDGIAASLIASESWQRYVVHLRARSAATHTGSKKAEDEGLLPTALLMPDSQLDTFSASIASLPPDLVIAPRAYIDFCKSLGETAPVAPLPQPSQE
jgi:hypothetical protein